MDRRSTSLLGLFCGAVAPPVDSGQLPWLLVGFALSTTLWGRRAARAVEAPGLRRLRGVVPEVVERTVGGFLIGLVVGLLVTHCSQVWRGPAPEPDTLTEWVGEFRGQGRLEAFGGQRYSMAVARYRQRGEWRVWRGCVEVALSGQAAGSLQQAPGTIRFRGLLTPRRGTRSRCEGVVHLKSWRLVSLDAYRAPRKSPTIRAGVRQALLEPLRLATVDRRAESLEGSPGEALMATFLFGRREQLPPVQRRLLRRVGLAHLLAVSGVHLACLIGLFVGGLRLLLRSRRAVWIACCFAVWGYRGLVGSSASIDRASLMFALIVLAFVVGRRLRPRDGLASTAVLLVLAQPEWAMELGFQLSVVATWAVLSVLRRRGRSGGVRGAVDSTLAAQWATAPLLWPLFASVQPLAAGFHLLAAPWLVAVLAVSLCCCVLLLLEAAVGSRWLPLEGANVDCLRRWVTGLLDLFAMPLDLLARTRPSIVEFAPVAISRAGALTIAVAVWLMSRRVGWMWASLVGFALILGISGASRQPESDGARFSVLDIGQGDAVLLQSAGRSALVDGGGWARGDVAYSRLVALLAARGVQRLDRVIVTHDDADHCKGILELASYLVIAEIWLGPDVATQEALGGCRAELARRVGSRLRVVWAGDKGRIGDWSLEVLYPGPRPTETGSNALSLVLRAEAYGRTVLLTGDLESSQERRMLLAAGRERLRADILKVGHHGSQSSSGTAFLAAVDPRLALISAGRENRFGHPHPSVLARLAGKKIAVLRTDLHGSIDLELDRMGWVVRTPDARSEGE